MSMKLFVGGLSFDTDKEGLRRGFESFGEIEDVAVISDRETGRSRGFGFVTFREEADGKKAMAALDGQMLDGRTVRVNEATAKAPRSGGGGGYGGGGGGGGFGGQQGNVRGSLGQTKGQIMGSTSLPTAQQMRSSVELREDLVKVVSDTNELINAIPAIYDVLGASGAKPAALKPVGPVPPAR